MQTAKYVVEPLLQALRYLEQHAVIHRDIKPENILISGAGTLKLADFGLSIVASEELPVTRVGTLAYMSPEVVACPRKSQPGDWKHRLDLAYGSQVDVWALGMLVFELVVGRPPLRVVRSHQTGIFLEQNPVLENRTVIHACG
jgi:serine/threonine protein kinase